MTRYMFSRCELTSHEDLPGRARSEPTSHEDMPQPLELTTSCFLLWSCRFRRVCAVADDPHDEDRRDLSHGVLLDCEVNRILLKSTQAKELLSLPKP